MSEPTGSDPSLTVDTTAKRVVSRAGAVLLSARMYSARRSTNFGPAGDGCDPTALLRD